MGFFGGSKKSVPNTSFSRMIGDSSLKSAIQQGIQNYVFNGGDYAEILRDASFHAMHRKLHRLRKWADRPDTYPYGVPEAKITSIDGGAILDYIESYINSTEGITLTKEYVALGGINHYHMAWDYLMDNFDYNPKTNILDTGIGVPVYVHNIQIHYHASIVDRYTEIGRAPKGWSGLSGATQNRAADYDAAIPAYVIDAPDHDYAQVSLTCRGTFTTTQTVIERKVTRTLIVYPHTEDITYTATSDITDSGYDFTEPPYLVKTAVTLGVDDSPAPTTDFVSTYSDATYDYVEEDVTTITITVDTYDYAWDIENNFLSYEYSGDPLTVLDDTDTPNIDPDAEAVAPVDADTDWIIFGYTYTESGTDHIGYFTYALGSGELPDLEDNIYDSTTIGEYYPRLYARLNGRKCNADDLLSTPEYLASRKFSRRLGFTFDKWVDGLHDNVGSLDKVWGIALGFNVPMNTDNDVDLEYLHKYFKRHYLSLDPSSVITDITGAAFTEARIFNSIHLIEDSVMKQSLDYVGIAYSTGTGSGFTPDTYEKIIGSCAYNRYLDTKFTYSGGDFATSYSIVADTPMVHTYRYYTSTTTYEEYNVLGASSGVQVRGNLWSSATYEDSNLMVPLDDSMRLEMDSRRMETLAGRSAHIIFNTITVVKTKWYQTTWFQVVMFIIVVIITVYAGPETGALAAKIAYAVVVAVTTQIAITVAFQLLIKLGLDPKIAAVIVVIAAVLAGQGNKAATYLSTARGMLETFNLTLQMYSKALEYEMKDIAKDMAALADLKKDLLDKYSEQLDSLVNNSNALSVNLISNRSLSPLINLGETSESFYARTSIINVAELLYAELLGYYALKLSPPSAYTSTRKLGEA